MSNYKKDLLKIKIKGYFNDGMLRVDPSITVLVRYYIDKVIKQDIISRLLPC